MTTNLRLTVGEQKLLQKKGLELNNKLVRMGKAPIPNSKIMHFILLEALTRSDISESGSIIIGELNPKLGH